MTLTRRRSLFAICSIFCSALVGLLTGCAGKGKAVAGDPAAMARLGCDSPQACFTAGQQAEEAKDTQRAAALYRVACDGGSGGACLYLAEHVPDKVGYWKRACELGEDRSPQAGPGTGCVKAAEQIAPRDPATAIALYRKACVGGMVGACEPGCRLAVESQRYPDAAELARGGCNDRAASTCGLLGALHVLGKGVDRNPELARQLLTRGCDARDDEACRNKKQLEEELAKGARSSAGASAPVK